MSKICDFETSDMQWCCKESFSPRIHPPYSIGKVIQYEYFITRRLPAPCVTRVTTNPSKCLRNEEENSVSRYDHYASYIARFTSHKFPGSRCHSQAFLLRCRKHTRTIAARLAQCLSQTLLQRCNEDCFYNFLCDPLGPQLLHPSLIFGCR